MDKNDILLIEWALTRIEYLKDIDKEKAEEFEKDYFSCDFINYLLDNMDFPIIAKLFAVLTPESFKNSLEKVKDKWSSDDDDLSFEAASIIAGLDPDGAFELFLKEFPSIKESELNLEKFAGVLNATEHLGEEKGKEIVYKLIEDYIESEFSMIPKSIFLSRIIEAAWKYSHPECLNLMKEFFINTPVDFEDYCRKFISDLCELFASSGEDFNFIYEYYYENVEKKYVDQKFFFKPEAPLKRVDETLKAFAEDNNYGKIKELFCDYRGEFKNEKSAEILFALINDDSFIEELEEEDSSLFLFYMMILSCLITSMRAESVSPEGITVDEVLDILSEDIYEVPSFNSFADFLKKEDRALVTKKILNKLEADDDRDKFHLIEITGVLAFEEFLPALVKFLGDELYCFRAKDALLNYGEKAYGFIENNFSSMDKYEREFALHVIENMGKDKVRDFLIKNFSLVVLKNKAKMLTMMDNFPCEEFIDKLEPFVDKGQIGIDHTYIILNKLYKNESKALSNLEDKLYDYRAGQDEEFEINDEKDILETIKPYVELELSCGTCKDESYYRLKNLTVDFLEDGDMETCVPETLTCINCNNPSDFTVTEIGMEAVGAEIMKVAVIDSEILKKQAMEKSPLIISGKVLEDKAVTVSQSIEFYKREIERDPSEPLNYIYLGNIYCNTGRHFKAEELFEKAVGLGPGYVEAYYALADIAFRRDEHGKALEWLKKGLEYLDDFKARQDFEGSKKSFVKSYNEFYSDMEKKAVEEEKNIPPFKKEEKIGRNDPCPCKSGKKYKKCCLLK